MCSAENSFYFFWNGVNNEMDEGKAGYVKATVTAQRRKMRTSTKAMAARQIRDKSFSRY